MKNIKKTLNGRTICPMSNLSNYIDKDIYSIELVERNDDGSVDVVNIVSDELFYVDEQGHLVFSSYSCGVMSYDNSIRKYVKHYYGHRTEHKFVGFLSIEVEDEKED